MVGRTFAQALRQELAASQAASGCVLVCSCTNLSGLSLQEAQQILNISKLNPEEVQKVRA